MASAAKFWPEKIEKNSKSMLFNFSVEILQMASEIFKIISRVLINVQQILFKFWVLAHLHAYFVLHNSTEKNMVHNFFFTTYLLPTRLFGLHVYSVP